MEAGTHLPTTDELLMGMPCLEGSVQRDVCAFAERVLPRLRRKANPALGRLVAALEQATVSAELAEIREVAEALAEAYRELGVKSREWGLRVRIYMALLGDDQAAHEIAAEAAVSALFDFDRQEEAVLNARQALGWAVAAAAARPSRYLGRHLLPHRPTDVSMFVDLIGTQLETMIKAVDGDEAAAAVVDADDEDGDGQEKVEVSKEPRTSAVVVREIGLPGTKEGKDIQKTFQDIAAKALPLAPKPELTMVRSVLMAEFPYAQAVIDAMLGDLVPRSTSFVRPTVLVGTPGSGKTRFARRILTLLGIPHEVVSCGGVADGSFGGTARRWSTGEPALPVAAIARHTHAGPGIVLDEVEKVGASRHNGNAHDVLLGFFERESNRAFFDPYLQADCDLSHVSWIMTANSLEGVSPPLRDRCRIIMFPEPGPEHLAALAPRVMLELLADARPRPPMGFAF